MFGGKKTGIEAVADVGFGKRKNDGRRLQGFGKSFVVRENRGRVGGAGD